MDYSDPHENYRRVVETIEYLKSTKTSPSQRWIDEHAIHLRTYKRQFPSFSTIHPEITNVQFRKLLADTDDILDCMIGVYEWHKWFDVREYLKFNENILRIIKEVYSEDDLLVMFDTMTLT
jgi:hypothetical protein